MNQSAALQYDLTVDALKSQYAYDKRKGTFIRRETIKRHKSGEVAGWLDTRGYRRIKIAGTTYYAHRLAWLYTYGEWPGEIDHKNQKKADNRITNLRDATHSQNQRNKAYASIYRYPL